MAVGERVAVGDGVGDGVAALVGSTVGSGVAVSDATGDGIATLVGPRVGDGEGRGVVPGADCTDGRSSVAFSGSPGSEVGKTVGDGAGELARGDAAGVGEGKSVPGGAHAATARPSAVTAKASLNPVIGRLLEIVELHHDMRTLGRSIYSPYWDDREVHQSPA